MLATAPRVTKFPIDWGDGTNNDMESGAAENGEFTAEVTESNQIAVPSASATQQQDYSSRQSLGLGHDSNSLNLSEPMAS